MYKKKEEEAKGGAPEWMNTYGDMVTLLLTFFVLLFASSTLDTGKLAQIVASYSGTDLNLMMSGGADGINDLMGSGILETPTSRVPIKSTTNQKRLDAEAEMVKMASDFKTYFAEYNLEERINVTVTEDTITLDFHDDILFDSGRADLKPEAISALDLIAEVLLQYPDNLIEIEGHTDNVPINTLQFPSNWWLSSGRAIAVGEFFIDVKGLPPYRILAAGRGEFVPVAPNDTPENRAKNRRVVIMIRNSYLSDLSGM